MLNQKHLNILGIRGVPGSHGGFETFATHLAPYLAAKGWSVTVYCQLDPVEEGIVPDSFEDEWKGVRRVHIGTERTGSVGSVIFDWRCIRDVLRRPGIDLVLGYNTAVFCILQRLYGRRVIMNMDGIEWKRGKWRWPIKAWFYVNEFIGANLANRAIADHPEIARHLKRHGCFGSVVIPYGSDSITSADESHLAGLGLEKSKYIVSIARIEQENSVLEFVRAFSRKTRGIKLVVLGKFDPNNDYHTRILEAASDEVIFPGAIYDAGIVSALRFFALAYVHGHQVGGTNPSLVEALGAGNAVIAHDNRFNRWVAGPEQFYFGSEDDFDAVLETVTRSPERVEHARQAARGRHSANFTWDIIFKAYEDLLLKYVK
ncbi:Glycosyl transferases group 1 [Hartmannibacter diazotrophicus]|uniref:Glycosyl transferases group 1 n=1 Tax=Hartmannibacter diazotrophicus TaxID=1482074 RepID=A0A2C9DDH1_9HYPH|nr:DUF1972 domain-containing protein [Hartmannibacter diazotrophicus]SON58364.1 Glycosyl transferases group 1 [Hartmannibacter diazotrophicus]